MYDTATDIARIIVIVQCIVMLALFRRDANYAGNWTLKGLLLFSFQNVMLVFLIFLEVEKLLADAEPAVMPCLLPFVFIVGIIGAAKKGPLMNSETRKERK